MLVLVVATAVVGYLALRVFQETATFDTDEADHANAILELYYALRGGTWDGIESAILRQSFYPPLHSLTALPVSFVLHPSLAASRLPSVIALLLYSILFVVLVRRAVGDSILSLTAGARTFAVMFCGLVAVTSPILVFNSALCMLEPLGALLMVLLLLVFAREGEEELSWNRIFLGATGVVLLFLTKYSFGIFALGGFGLFLLCQWFQGRVSFVRCIICAGYICLALAAWFLVSDWQKALSFVFDQPPARHALLSSENIFFYPRVFFRMHVVHPWVGVMILFFAILGLWNDVHRPIVQLSWCLFVIGFAALFLSPENGSRHIIPVIPPLFLLAAFGGAAFLEWGERTSGAFRLVWRSGCCLLVVGLLVTIFFRVQKFPETITKRYESKPYFANIFESIATLASRGPVLVEGLSDSMSLEGLRWWVAKDLEIPYTKVKVDGFPFTSFQKIRAPIHSRNEAAPWVESNVPDKPLSDTLQSGYYRSFVRIYGTAVYHRLNNISEGSKKDLSEEYLETLMSTFQEIHGVRVQIYSVPVPS
ncbi:MAG: hypothetical protein KDD64_03410 [Bdellovibrionales bacterium]|nr:hypothetical protein [Bdellovibrionales bacterium]